MVPSSLIVDPLSWVWPRYNLKFNTLINGKHLTIPVLVNFVKEFVCELLGRPANLILTSLKHHESGLNTSSLYRKSIFCGSTITEIDSNCLWCVSRNLSNDKSLSAFPHHMKMLWSIPPYSAHASFHYTDSQPVERNTSYFPMEMCQMCRQKEGIVWGVYGGGYRISKGTGCDSVNSSNVLHFKTLNSSRPTN